jgi:hypothetical protein
MNQLMWHLSGNHSRLLTVSIFEMQLPSLTRVSSRPWCSCFSKEHQVETSSQPRIHVCCNMSGISNRLVFRAGWLRNTLQTSKTIQRAGNGTNVIIHCSFWIINFSQLLQMKQLIVTPEPLDRLVFHPSRPGTQLTISLWFSLWFADVGSSQGKTTCRTGCIWSRLNPQRKQRTHHLHPHPQRLVFFQAPSYL